MAIHRPTGHRAAMSRVDQDTRRLFRSGREHLPELCCTSGQAGGQQGRDRLLEPTGLLSRQAFNRRGQHPGSVVDNTLDRKSDVEALDRAGETAITLIRTLEGFAYLAPRHCPRTNDARLLDHRPLLPPCGRMFPRGEVRTQSSAVTAPDSNVRPMLSIQRSSSAATSVETGANGARHCPTGTPMRVRQYFNPGMTPPRIRMAMKSLAIACPRRALSMSPASIALSIAT